MSAGPKIRVLLAFLLAAATWYYVDAVFIPCQRLESRNADRPYGNQSDLYPRWLASRELILHGRNPYGDDVTREIQMGYYGRPLDPTRPHDPRDESRFAYPLFVVFLFAPFIKLPFRDVQLLYVALTALLTAASVVLWSRAIGLARNRFRDAIVAILALGSFPVVQALHLQQLTLLVAGLLSAACAAVASGHLVAAGALLAVCAIKPQLLLPLLAWYALWAFADLRRRKRLLLSFSATLVCLLSGSLILMPGWFSDWWSAIHAYVRYTAAKPLPQDLLGASLGLLLAAFVVAGVAWIGWRSRHCTAAEFEYSLALVSVMTATLLVIPKWAPYDQVLLVPAVLLVWSRWPMIRQNAPTRLSLWFCVATFAWQWLAAIATAVATKFFGPAQVGRWYLAPLVTVPVVPFAAAACIALLIFKSMRGHRLASAATRP